MQMHVRQAGGTYLVGRGLASTMGTLPPPALTELANEALWNFLRPAREYKGVGGSGNEVVKRTQAPEGRRHGLTASWRRRR